MALQYPVKYPVKELVLVSRLVRQTILNLVYRAKASHVGCSLSVADILIVLYFGVMRIDPENPTASDRDRCILSKGHSISALYATLAHRGFFPKERLEAYGRDGSPIAVHGVRGAVPGIEVSTGSGGHGLSLGIGMALASRRLKKGTRVFVVAGDGEMAEGSVWEAVLFAGFHKIFNLKLIIDRNHFQDGQDGLGTDEILNLEPFSEKLSAFHWDVDVVDGHNFEELTSAFEKKTDRPHAIIANTLKGKGVSFMEGKPEWHGKSPNEEEYTKAIEELSQ